jgi:hypothetical protein
LVSLGNGDIPLIALRNLLLLATIGSCMALPALAEPAPDATARELIDMSQALMDALANNKPEVWKNALADDASVIDEFGTTQNTKEAVDGIHGLPAGFSGHIKLLKPSVRVWGDTAVVVCDADEYETVFGQQLHVLYRFTNTFVRRAHAWKLVAMEDVTVPTTPPTLAVADLHLPDYPGIYNYGPGRAYTIASDGKALAYTTKAGRPAIAMMPIARDVFMDGGDEKNLLIFRRDAHGAVVSLIERRKFNDLVLTRGPVPDK